MKSPYREVIQRIAQEEGVDPLLVEAIIQQESGGKADAFRHEPGYWLRYCVKDPKWQAEEPRRVASSYGLMQVMYPTAVDHGFNQEPEALFGIDANIRIGCRVVKRLLERFSGNVQEALAAYNGGVGGITRAQPLHYAHVVQLRYDTLRSAAQAARADRPGEPRRPAADARRT